MAEYLFDPDQEPELTYEEVFIVPNNPFLKTIEREMGKEVTKRLCILHEEADKAYAESDTYTKQNKKVSKKFASKAFSTEKAFMDAVLDCVARCPALMEILSRDEVDFRPLPIDVQGKNMRFGNVPIFIANMNTAVSDRTVEAANMVGATAVISQDMPEAELKSTIKTAHETRTIYRTATTVTSDTKINDLGRILRERDLDGKAVVVDADGRFESIVDIDHMPETFGINDTVATYPQPHKKITMKEGTGARAALNKMKKHDIKFLPVLKADGTVIGAVTEKALAMSLRYKTHKDNNNEGAAIAVAVPAMRKGVEDRVKGLLDLGVDAIVLDTANFDQRLRGYKNLQTTASLVDKSRQKVVVVAGNVVTEAATRRVIGAGADLVKAGVGPGSMCSTRIESGVGRPQMSAVIKTARAAANLGKGIVADGGIKNPRDVALAIAAGARYVMFGSLFAGTWESPPDLHYDANGKPYKLSAGMASRQESEKRSYERTEKDIVKIVRSILGDRSEGISGAQISMNPEHRSVADIIHHFMDGLTSAMTYVGAEDLEKFAEQAIIGLQTSSGYKEGEAKFKMAT